MYFSFTKKRKRKKGLYKAKLKIEMMKTFSKFMQSESEKSKPVQTDGLINDMLRIGSSNVTSPTSKTRSLPVPSNLKISGKKGKKNKKKFKPIFSLSSITSTSNKPKYDYTLGASFKDLANRIQYLTGDEGEPVDKEFEELNHVDYTLNREEGMFATGRSHPKLNRFKGIVANEDTRIRMKSKKYINANFVPGHLFRIPFSYIATQAPLPNTVDLFWDMIWENNSRVIVMFQEIENTPVHSFVYKDYYDLEGDKEEEEKKKEEKKPKKKGIKGFFKVMSQPDCQREEEKGKNEKKTNEGGSGGGFPESIFDEPKDDQDDGSDDDGDGFGAMFRQRIIHQYWPEVNEDFRVGESKKREEKVLVTNMEEDDELLDREGIIIRKLKIEREGETRELFMYQYTKWPDMSVPSDPVAFLNLVHRVHDKSKELHEKGATGPIILHCVAGIGRTGTFACVHIVISQLSKFMDIKKKAEEKEREDLSKQFLMFADDVATPKTGKGKGKGKTPFDEPESEGGFDTTKWGEKTPTPTSGGKKVDDSMFDSPKIVGGKSFGDGVFDSAAPPSPNVFDKMGYDSDDEQNKVLIDISATMNHDDFYSDMEDEFEYNFFDIVKKLKQRRKGMVQRIEQYKFCYEVVLEEAKKLGIEKDEFLRD